MQENDLRTTSITTVNDVFRLWLPLAASWMLMALELPVVSAVIARLPDSAVNLAAFGSVALPLAMVIEAPIMMLLAASTALSTDRQSYTRLKRFMLGLGSALTLFHALLALTPLYYLLAHNFLDAPQPTLEPARMGMIVMIPWTFAIAFRRFHQGILIRFGRSRVVGWGTLVRLLTDLTFLGVGYLLHITPGAVLGCFAVTAGVIVEALFIWKYASETIRERMPEAAPGVTLDWQALLHFYVPLALTPFLTMLIYPMMSAALSRMPDALASLAVFPVLNSFTVIIRGLGIAYNEVVIALSGKENALVSLRKFMQILALVTSTLLILVTVTPAAEAWFLHFTGLAPELAELAVMSLWFYLPVPALTVLQSWYQGIVTGRKQTRLVIESVALFLLGGAFVLLVGVWWGRTTGIYVGAIAVLCGNFCRVVWLSRKLRLGIG